MGPMTEAEAKDFFYTYIDSYKKDWLSDEKKDLLQGAVNCAIQYIVKETNKETSVLNRKRFEIRDAGIYSLRASGMSLRDIADKYNMSVTRVQQIIREYDTMLKRREQFGTYSYLLSKHTLNVLRAREITNAEQLLKVDTDRLYYTRGAGESTVLEVSMWQRKTREGEQNA